MPRKKKAPKKPIEVKRDMVQLGGVDVGDFCYFISSDGARRFGKVLKVLPDDPVEPAMQLQCQSNWSFHIGLIRLAAWDEKSLKGLKWDLKADLTRKEGE